MWASVATPETIQTIQHAGPPFQFLIRNSLGCPTLPPVVFTLLLRQPLASQQFNTLAPTNPPFNAQHKKVISNKAQLATRPF